MRDSNREVLAVETMFCATLAGVPGEADRCHCQCPLLLLACAARSPDAGIRTVHTVPGHRCGEQHTVALLGATGMAGRLPATRRRSRAAIRCGHWRGRRRSSTNSATGSLIVQGDARDPAVIEELLRGSDVVISALGPVKKQMGMRPRFINSTAATGNVSAAVVNGKARKSPSTW